MSDKCIVHGCLNRKHQGNFTGDLCMPCHNMLTSGEVKYGETFIHGLRDRIEDLEAENKELEGLNKYWREHSASGWNRCEELEGMLPEDNRPCSTDRFLVAVVDEIDDHHDRLDAIKCWIEGAWDEAVEGTTLAELKGQDQ